MRRHLPLALLLVLGAIGGWHLLQSNDDGGKATEIERGPEAAPAPEGARLAGREVAPESPAPLPPLGGACTIRGFVRSESGAPLPGIRVDLTAVAEPRAGGPNARFAFDSSRAPTVVATATSAADGSFVFTGAPYKRTFGLIARLAPPAYAGRYWANTNPAYQSRPPVIVVREGVPLRLHVVDAKGRGRRAFVSARHRSVDPEPSDARVRHIWWVRQLGSTDGEGRLFVPAVPAGRLRLGVAVPGFGKRAGLFIESRGDEEVVVCVEDADGATLSGRVRDEQNQPIPGASVYLEVRGDLPIAEYAARAVMAAADGTFRIERLMPGRLEDFVVSAPGYLRRKDALPSVFLEPGSARYADVLLERGLAIEGTLRGPDGAPVADARVQAKSVPSARLRRFTLATSETFGATEADAAGRYRLDGLPPVPGLLWVSAPGFYGVGEDGTYGARQYDPEAGGETRQIDLRLKACLVVKGKVVERSGDPVAGAQIEVRARSRPAALRPRRRDLLPWTDGGGRFALGGLVPGRWSVWAFTETGRTERVELELAEGEEPAPLRLLWRTGAVIAGRVVSEPPMSVGRARVRCRRPRTHLPAIAVADDGSFRFEGLVAGTYELSVVDFNLDAEPGAVQLVVDWGEVVDDVVLRTRAMGEIAGLVTDEEGAPQGGVRVSIRIQAGSNEDGGRPKRATTGADGRFWFSCVPDVPYMLFLEGEKQPGVARVSQVDIRLVRPAPPEIRFEGRVRGPDGEPVAAAVLDLTHHEAKRRMHESFPVVDGRFLAVFRMRGNRVDIKVRDARGKNGTSLGARPYRQEGVDVSAGPLEIRLERGLVIAGHVEGPPPADCRAIRLALWPAPENDEGDPEMFGAPFGFDGRWEVGVDAEARFEFSGLAPGRYAVAVSFAPEGWVAPRPVFVDAGDRHAEGVRIVLKPR